MTGKRLGRGLDFLISETAHEGENVLKVRVQDLQPNPFQPRRVHDETAEKELVESIRLHGVLQPIVVRLSGKGYEIVAGERRWRAAKKAGLAEIPCVRRRAEDAQMRELALVENIQRQDLNPMEKATAFQQMIEEMELTQEGVSKRIGMSRAAVANFLRLLALPPDIQESVSRGTISFGHAKAIMALEDAVEQEALHRKILAIGLSVRETEKEAKKRRRKTAKKKGKFTAQIADLEEMLMKKLGTKVRVAPAGKGGKIIIEFYSSEDFERICELIG